MRDELLWLAVGMALGNRQAREAVAGLPRCGGRPAVLLHLWDALGDDGRVALALGALGVTTREDEHPAAALLGAVRADCQKKFNQSAIAKLQTAAIVASAAEFQGLLERLLQEAKAHGGPTPPCSREPVGGNGRT